MAKKQGQIFQDPRYRHFRLKYRHDLVRFGIEVCGMPPTWQQLGVQKAFQEPGS